VFIEKIAIGSVSCGNQIAAINREKYLLNLLEKYCSPYCILPAYEIPLDASSELQLPH